MGTRRRQAVLATFVLVLAVQLAGAGAAEAGGGSRAKGRARAAKVSRAKAVNKSSSRTRSARARRAKRPASLRRKAPGERLSKSRQSKQGRNLKKQKQGSQRNLASSLRSKFIDSNYRPKKSDFRAVYYVKPAGMNKAKTKKQKREVLTKALDTFAAETSTGTWTDVKLLTQAQLGKLAPTIYRVKKGERGGYYVEVAYPPGLFEPGNVGQIMATVAGDIFATPKFDGVRLLDIAFSQDMMRSLPGPAFGAEGVQKMTGVKGRPLLGTIFKPKMGFKPEQAYKMALDAYTGGLDQLKDDEATTAQKAASFEARTKMALKAAKEASRRTGKKKIFVANVTSATADQMIQRAKFVKKNGGTHVMVDVLTSGLQALQTLRDANLGLVIQAHRAGHAAVTRGKDHGINMRVYGKILRAAGADLVAVGTPGIGKMPADSKEVYSLKDAVTQKKIERHGHYLDQNWGKMKGVLPVVSGGLHPGLVHEAMEKVGNNVLLQFGGGTHGHPEGTRVGAKAIKQAADAARAGVSVRKAGRDGNNKALQRAIEQWGTE